MIHNEEKIQLIETDANIKIKKGQQKSNYNFIPQFQKAKGKVEYIRDMKGLRLT